MSKYSLETQYRIHGREYYIQVAHDWETDSCEISLGKQQLLYLSCEEVELLIKALRGYLDTRPKP